MRAIRLYIDQKLAVHDEVRLADSIRHHACDVLRISKHSPLVLFNGDGYDYTGLPASLHKKELTVRITGRIRAGKESFLETHLVLGVLKSARMDYAIQKTVEAGVTAIHPVVTERTVIRFSGKSRANRLQHWQNVIISACEQCGRADLPILHEVTDLADLSAVGVDAQGYFLDASAGQTLARSGHDPLKKAWFVIGPEGGLTRSEAGQVTEKGFQAVTLGPRILRTETAAAAAIICAQVLWGDMAGRTDPRAGEPGTE